MFSFFLFAHIMRTHSHSHHTSHVSFFPLLTSMSAIRAPLVQTATPAPMAPTAAPAFLVPRAHRSIWASSRVRPAIPRAHLVLRVPRVQRDERARMVHLGLAMPGLCASLAVWAQLAKSLSSWTMGVCIRLALTHSRSWVPHLVPSAAPPCPCCCRCPMTCSLWTAR